MKRRDGGGRIPRADTIACRWAGQWSSSLSAWMVLTAVIAGVALPPPLVGEDSPAAADRPVMEEPILLSPSAVRLGLGVRLQRMEERYEAERQLRLQRAPRDYAAPRTEDAALPPGQAPVPLPPDVAGGELQLEQVGDAP